MSFPVQLVPISIEKHAQLLFDWRTNPEIHRFMYSPGPKSLEEHIDWLSRIAADKSHERFVVQHGTKPVGTAALVAIDLLHDRADFDMYIGDPHARMRGVGAAAEILALDHAFGKMSLHKVSCEVFSTNESAIRMHLRMGFTREGTLRDHARTADGWVDVIRLSILAPEWANSRPKLIQALGNLIQPNQIT